MSSITFGTDGWRAEMGRDFTFDQVRNFAFAYSDYLKKKFSDDIRILVNFDTRFLSSRFAEEVVKILSLRNIKAFISERDTPVPAISYYITKENFHGAVNFTAGVKSPIFNGIKILYILNSNGIETISIHNFPYSSFGNLISDCSREGLSELSSAESDKKKGGRFE